MPQGCQGPFRSSGDKVGFLARCCSTKRPQLALRGESPGFSRVAAGFFSSYDGDLRDPLVGPQRGPVSTQITRGPSGFLCSRCPGRGSHLDLSPEPQVSSPMPTWISVFLWASGGKSGLVSCGTMQVHSPLDPEKQCQCTWRFDHRDQWLSLEAPQGCYTCHRVLSPSTG